MPVILDSYSESNQDNSFTFQTGSPSGFGQSFDAGGGGVLNSASLYLKKNGSPGGIIRFFIYAHTGTYGDTGVPTGSILATSDQINASALSTSFALVNLTFSGGNKITLSASTKYFLVLDTASITGSGSDSVGVGEDASSPTAGGNIASFFSGAWHAFTGSTQDLPFYVYRDDAVSPSSSLSPSSSISPSASDSPSFSVSPSSSGSPSASISSSPSSSYSPSASNSPSSSVSPSSSPSSSPSPSHAQFELGIMRVAKDGKSALNNPAPTDLKFSSEYGTLKYFTKQAVHVQFTADPAVGVNSGKGSYSHNLNYYPYCEVYVSVNGGDYEYCPFAGSGATLLYSANVIISKTKIDVYGEVSGIDSSVWTFDFLIFVFKNDLHLS